MQCEECMTFKEKMESEGWHNCYDMEPPVTGMYTVYRGNGSVGKAYYCGNHTWENKSGWSIYWWK